MLRILIAEDDAVSRVVLQMSLAHLGHRCVSAIAGDEAWNIFKASPDLDVVISGLMMPGIDGLELCRRIRAYSGRRDGYLYFIFLTAFADKDHYVMGMDAGADDYLTKPLDLVQLRACLSVASRVISLQKSLLEQKKQLERINRVLVEQVRQDPLTRLGNRLSLRENLAALQYRTERYGHSYCAGLCDIDSFKALNDRYGHLVGDQALQRVAKAIAGHCRGGDAVYRLGGDEFLLLLPEQTLPTAFTATNRVRRSVEALAIPNGAEVITVSIGLAELVRGQQKTAEVLIEEADLALYEAKRRGGNRVEVYADALDA